MIFGKDRSCASMWKSNVLSVEASKSARALCLDGYHGYRRKWRRARPFDDARSQARRWSIQLGLERLDALGDELLGAIGRELSGD